MFASAVHELRFACSWITLHKDPTMWLDWASPHIGASHCHSVWHTLDQPRDQSILHLKSRGWIDLNQTRAMFASAIHELRFACSWITLNKDPTVWLDWAISANTCILPSYGCIALSQCVACRWPAQWPINFASQVYKMNRPKQTRVMFASAVHELRFAC